MSDNCSMPFALRAGLAILSLLLFYLFAVSLMLALGALPIYVLVRLHRFNWYFMIGCFGAAWSIAKGLAPQRDVFEAPGPLLEPSAEPELFQALRSVAVATEQTMPKEVYLIPEANAWVAQRGGFLGIGGHRVMAIGLPGRVRRTTPSSTVIIVSRIYR